MINILQLMNDNFNFGWLVALSKMSLIEFCSVSKAPRRLIGKLTRTVHYIIDAIKYFSIITTLHIILIVLCE